ncbi:MAG: penicillin-binding protein 2 [Thermogemmatispora sp.]|uniref:peptidoglycan D,D-transpeptidase FtsI family protein n=1 Tax=Thermogemmatispora sp. TaxID=1968838 RepID=UPI00261B994B|nr:penicillin-binding protein 2 [Thermogemmatispora sp.]MBX5456129.1 penicillin-binding protein 2 [Thermogemmatispora sp.]
MNINSAIRRLNQIFIVLFLGLSLGLVYWQVAVAQQVTSNIHNIRQCMKDHAPVRGKIYDRNGVLLAESKPIDPNNPFKGVLCGYQRHYYLDGMPSLANLIGFYISPLFNSTGIEHAFDDYLSGRAGLTELTNNLNLILHRPPVGDNIYLTIDTRIQKIVERDFDKYAPSYNPPVSELKIDNENVFATNRGAVIVTDPHTGEILAMVTRPTYDSNRVAAGDLAYYNQLLRNPDAPLLERPIQGQYVPGSVYKAMTLLAALDTGTYQLNTPSFDYQHAVGPVTIGGEVFSPQLSNIYRVSYARTFPVSMNMGFSHSDNVMFAVIGSKLGADTWLEYNKRFYVGQDIPFDLPVARSSVLPPNGQLPPNLLAEDSFGQGVDLVTPMLISLIDDAIANNGQLMRPMLVSRIQAPDGTIIKSMSPQTLSTPISEQTATSAREAMYGVVRCGSGSVIPELYSSPWNIIAKTGTGQVGGGKAAHGWLMTQAPYQDPRLTIVSMRENAGEGANVNGPAVAAMYNDIYTSVLKLQQPAPADPSVPYCTQHGLWT